MRLKYLFLFIVFAVLILLLIFFLNGLIPHTTPPGLNLSISENISPDAEVVVLDNDKNVVTSLGTNEWFFLQQRGLPKGTTYGFRVIDEGGNEIMPVYETFVAKAPGWVEQNKYYHNLMPGKYIIELLTIKDDSGAIIARTNLSIFNLEAQHAELEKAIIDNCSYLMSEPIVDADGWSREGKLGECAAKVGAELGNVDACSMSLKAFNLTAIGYEECIRNYAIATGDTSACDLTGMPKSRGFCKAKATKDWTECRKISCDFSCVMEKIETQQDLCIQWYAIENRNASLCNEIKSAAYNMKDICLNLTAKQ
ncbi:MAG: hypothetical protein V1921_04870 [Candidatus Altiarchaeota archaeon]